MCVSKVPVFNKEDGTYTYHNCGHCAECMNIKALSMSRLLKNEFLKSNSMQCILLTLQYSNQHVPLVEVVRQRLPIPKYDRIDLPFPTKQGRTSFKIKSDDFNVEDRITFKSITPRVRDYFGNIIDKEFAYTREQKRFHNHLLKPITSGVVRGTEKAKNKLPENCFPILFFPDVQKYLKRVRDRLFTQLCKQFNYKRSKLSKDEKEKIRLEMSRLKVFYCGEYGPQSFRPHYHVLLFFDSQRIAECITQVLCSAWKMGNCPFKWCDTSGACRYVSEYLNSVVGLPPLYKYNWNKAKSRHSVRIGVSEDKEFNKDIHEISFQSITSEIVCRDGKFESFTYPVSVESYLFPKCYRFNKSVDSLLLARYELYDTVVKATKFTKIDKIVKYYFNETLNTLYCQVHPYIPNDVLFARSENKLSTFKNMLSISKRFLANKKRYSVSSYNYLRLIKRYYNEKSSFTLSKWYQLLQDDSKILEDSSHLINYYDNIPKDDIVDKVGLSKHIQFAEQMNIDLDKVIYANNHPEDNAHLNAIKMRSSWVMSQKQKHRELQEIVYENFIYYE